MISKLKRSYLLTRNIKMICEVVPTSHFFRKRLGLNEDPLEWAPLLKGRKLNERPGTHSDDYGM